MIKHWTSQQLAAMKRMRARFLEGKAGGGDYWRLEEDIALYDSTFAERIGWKWDAVLSELDLRRWQPQSRHVLDWGCGSGVAGRRVMEAWPQFASLTLHDRSPLAMRFAIGRAKTMWPALDVRHFQTIEPDTMLVLSHVINELPPPELAHLITLARQAREILWVEAGTHADSRRLIEVREQLMPEFTAIAPCTHQRACGLLTARNERHWCHHFARPPSAIFQDALWYDFSQEMGIDLRSLPYSFLVLSRDAPVVPPGCSRILGEPREFKGHEKVLSCQADGVTELMLQKRDAPDLYRTVRKAEGPAVYRWEREGGKIVGGEKLE